MNPGVCNSQDEQDKIEKKEEKKMETIEDKIEQYKRVRMDTTNDNFPLNYESCLMYMTYTIDGLIENYEGLKRNKDDFEKYAKYILDFHILQYKCLYEDYLKMKIDTESKQGKEESDEESPDLPTKEFVTKPNSLEDLIVEMKILKKSVRPLGDVSKLESQARTIWNEWPSNSNVEVCYFYMADYFHSC